VSEQLPYEEQLAQQWSDLPLPDENMAWADMKRRLEEDDDKPVVAWWRRGCGLWGLLLLVVLAIGWWILQPEKWFSTAKKENPVTNEQTVSSNQKNKEGNTNGNNTTNTSDPQTNSSNDPNAVNTPGDTGATSNGINTGTNTSSSSDSNTTIDTAGDGNTIPVTSRPGVNRSNTTNTPTRNRNNTGDRDRPVTGTDPGTVSINTRGGNVSRGQRRPNKPVPTKPAQSPSGNPPGQLPADPVNANTKNPPAVAQLDSPAVAIPKIPGPDTAITKVKPPADSITKKDSAVKKPVAALPDDKQKKKTFWSAGIAVHQLLPVAGQKTSPYNSLGRKGTLLDYIPSAYVRFNKENKWFIQAEFRYGAPQYAKSTLYDQVVVPDTGTNPRFVNTTSSRLQKTYYHQLPLSFNYYVMPNWSVGAGVVWNKFSTAIIDKEVNNHNNITQRDSIITKVILQEKGDSATAFSKSYFQAMLESQYQWKRFSIGARYSIGIDPFIRITLPNQPVRQERNQSFQLFIRYQLWRSKSK
jgi:hypothetical protein